MTNTALYLLLSSILAAHHPSHVHAFLPSTAPSFALSYYSRRPTTTSSPTELWDSMDDQDWRAFRAKLVMQEQQGEETQGTKQPAITSTSDVSEGFMATPTIDEQQAQQHWIHEQTILETGSILVHTPRPQDIYGLGKQGLYQSVIVIIETNPDQTLGIILNRPTDFSVPTTSESATELQHAWMIHYGGDEHSIHSDEPRYYVLQEQAGRDSKTSLELLSGFHLTSMHDIATKASTPNIYSGHVSWSTDDLEAEMERGIWKCLSMDAETIRTSNPNDFLSTWGSSDTKCTFDERMFHEWSQRHLTMKGKSSTKEEDEDCDTTTRRPLQAGDMIRTSATDDHAFLFSDQEFYQSLLLVIQEDDDFTVAVLLNHATTIREKLTDLPVRYGGNFRHDEIFDELPPFCLHYLGGIVDGGERVGDFFDKASIQQAAAAIEQGVASPEDFLVVQGMTVWPKDEYNLETDCFEVVDPTMVPKVWQSLSTQDRLSPLVMEANVDIARHAWGLAAASSATTDEKARMDDDSSSDPKLLDLGMDAVKTWIAAYLLEDSDYRP
jgi:putative AlgH/UPF0301 family transcriptional regulator